MKNMNSHAWILWGIALAVFAAAALLLPFVHTAVFWLTLVCSLAMFALTAGVFVRAFRRGGTLESKLLGWPVFRVALTMLPVQLVISLVLMALSALCPVWVALLAEVLVCAAALAMLTVRDAVREVVTGSEAAVPDRTGSMKAMRAQAAALAAQLDEGSAKAAMEKLAEELKYADPVSLEATADAEAELSALLDEIGRQSDMQQAEKLIADARRLLARRNLAAKAAKRGA